MIMDVNKEDGQAKESNATTEKVTHPMELVFGNYEISGERGVLESILGMKLPSHQITLLFGGINNSQIRIQPDGKAVDVWTSHAWFESPLYFTLERDVDGILLTINDFFLLERAPKLLGTCIMAQMIGQAKMIPGFYEIAASATRLYPSSDGETLRELNGYYFFPRVGFNGDPKNADDFVEIPAKIRGKKLLAIMRDADLRQWWKENGQTIDVRFKIHSKACNKALSAYLAEKGLVVE
jgi:hypothetical protein